MQNEITIYKKMEDLNPVEAVNSLGKWLFDSGMLGVKDEKQAKILALTCMTEKISPMEFLRTYDIIHGRPSKKAAAMQAEFQAKGGRIDWNESTNERVTATIYHEKYCAAGFKQTLTLAELKTNGVANSEMYKKFPRQMLRARLVSELIRMIDPSINAGIYCEEELDGIDVKSIKNEKKEEIQKENSELKIIPRLYAFGIKKEDIIAIFGDDKTKWPRDILSEILEKAESFSEDDRREYLQVIFKLEPGSLL